MALREENAQRVAERLLLVGEIMYSAPEQVRDRAPADRVQEVNGLVTMREEPFAFLLFVLASQSVRAEAALSFPWELAGRLGHLDPARIAEEPGKVREAITMRPALHRYVNTMSRWVVSAAERIVAEYGGDAARLWNDRPSAKTLQARLSAFKGIGQKKAAMAVELLERDMGVPIAEMDGSDVAYDVHVRRVFLRTGLVDEDNLVTVVEAARKLNPERPGALDGPAWTIGREWCRPRRPRCGECPLGDVCEARVRLNQGETWETEET